MKHLFTLLVFLSVTIITHAQPATMLEKEQRGAGVSAGMLLSEDVTGVFIDAGIKFNEKVDFSLTLGREAYGAYFSDHYVAYIGAGASWWFVSKEVGSDALFKTGLTGGAVYGKANDRYFEPWNLKVSTFQGFGGVCAYLNYNPGGGFFILQPSVASAYSAGWQFSKSDSHSDSYFIDQVVVTGGLSFGFKTGNGSVLSFNFSKGFSDTPVDPFGFGVEFAFPVK